jgi:hypothetical protein
MLFQIVVGVTRYLQSPFISILLQYGFHTIYPVQGVPQVSETRSIRVGTIANKKNIPEIRKQSSKAATIASFFTMRCNIVSAF